MSASHKQSEKDQRAIEKLVQKRASSVQMGGVCGDDEEGERGLRSRRVRWKHRLGRIDITLTLLRVSKRLDENGMYEKG